MLGGEMYAWENNKTGFLKQLELGKSYIHGIDKQNRPITVIRARLHRASDQTPDDLEKFTVWTMETVRLMIDDYHDTATVLFDLSHFTVCLFPLLVTTFFF